MQYRIAVLALAPLLMLAAGCDPDGWAGGSSSAPPVMGSSAPPVTRSSAPPGSAAPSAPQPRSPRCRTDELQVTAQGSPGGGAAGNVYAWLVFTNTSARSCTLYGYPGVSWVSGPSGRQVNDPLVRMTDRTPDRVVLAPRGAGHAVERQGQPDLYGPGCNAVEVAGFRVYPPDETAPVFVPWPTRVCSANGVGVGSVSPIVAGLSE